MESVIWNPIAIIYMSSQDSRSVSSESDARFQKSPVTRRKLLQSTGGLVLTSAVGGCLGINGSSDVIRNHSFSGQSLTVHLAESNDVSEVNFIDPDGRNLYSASVSTGQTTVDLPLIIGKGIESKPLSGGTYEIVAANGSTEIARKSVEIKLQYDVSIEVVKNAYDSPTTINAFIKNTGNAPLEPREVSISKGSSTDKVSSITTNDYLDIDEQMKAEFTSILSFGKAILSSEKPQCKGNTKNGKLFTQMTHMKKKTQKVKIVYGGKASKGNGVWICTNPSVTIIDENK